MRTAHPHDVKLSPDQQALVDDEGPWARACRDVWNAALDERLGALTAARRRKMPKGWWPTRKSQDAQLPAIKAVCPWVAEAPAHVLQQVLLDLDDAWWAWLKGDNGRPRFRARKRHARNWWAPSYRFPDRATPGNRRDFTQPERTSKRWGRLHLTKLGWVTFRWDRDLPDGATVTNVTLKQDRVGDWTVAFAIHVPDTEAVHPNPGSVTGADRGVVTLAATSDGALYDREILEPDTDEARCRLGTDLLTDGEREHQRRLERAKARQQPGSNNHAKTRRSMAVLKRRQARRRKDLVHKVSAEIAARYETVVLEGLDVRAMTRSAKGTVEEPGTGVAQKRGLNRAISGKGWGMLKTCLAYKTQRMGGGLVEVNPAYSSQTCHVCGTVDKSSRENQAEFVCRSCGHECHADVNAACVVLARGSVPASGAKVMVPAAGRVVAACGALPLGGAVKQEPARTRSRDAA
jgi:putative transposase